MNFMYTQYFFLSIISFGLMCFVFYKYEVSFFQWVGTYWNLKRSWAGRISTYFFILSLLCMILSLLDLRGPTERIESRIPDQKTIILIDNSASMLVQDVRPNRFERALVLARHFVKKSSGHQISVILFSDTHKRILPFTDDIDLLDARIAGLRNLNLKGGGSGIFQAIAETVNYFKYDNPDKTTSPTGNILLFTDAEEHGHQSNMTLPPEINLAVVALGTQSGGRVPIRSDRGVLMGYKKYQGREIISKVSEDNIKSIGKGLTSFRYWITLSYNLPTEEILSFFRTSFKQSLSNQMVTIRPILVHYLVLPAIAFYALYTILFKMPAFTLSALFLLTLNIWGNYKSLDEPIERTPDAVLTEKFKKGQASTSEKERLAKEFLDYGQFEKSKHIYKDIMDESSKQELANVFNYATSLLFSGEVDLGMKIYGEIAQQTSDEDIKKMIQNNIMYFFNQAQNAKNGQDSQQEEDKKESQNGEQQTGQSGDSENSNAKKESGQQETSESEEENSEDQPDADPSQHTSIEEREKDIEEKRKLTKTPALLKKLMQDDRDLQQKYLDTRTQSRQSTGGRKDW